MLGRVVILLKRELVVVLFFGGMIGGMRIFKYGMARLFHDLVGGGLKVKARRLRVGLFLVGMARVSNR